MSNKQTTWQPIDTVPKDGTRIDLWGKWWRHDTDTFDGRRFADCYWMPDRKAFSSEHSLSTNVRFTHWMPLPEPPQ